MGSINTKWTIVYKFNAIFYTILAVQSLCLVAGVVVIPMRIITSFCHCFITGFIHLSMIITTGVYRYSAIGRACVFSQVHTSIRSTFRDDGEFI